MSTTTVEKMCLELIALKVLPTCVRCVHEGQQPIVYRKVLNVIPGSSLTVEVSHRWSFRKAEMVSGELTHLGFSVGALRGAGYLVPGLRSPDKDGWRLLTDPVLDWGELQERYKEAVSAMAHGDWLDARALLLGLAEKVPGSALVHEKLGAIYWQHLRQTDLALAHYSAAVRLGMAPLKDVQFPADLDGIECLSRALLGRAEILEWLGRTEAAISDKRRLRKMFGM